MSKKSKKKNFKTNPFSDLKGFSVPEVPPATPKQPERSVVPEPDGEDFGAAMDWLGVKKLDSKDERVSHPEPVPPSEPLAVSSPARNDEDEFLAALGQMDVRFEDEFPIEPGEAPAARRMKQLRRGKLHVEGEVDLHGLTRAEALDKFQFFLANASHQGWQTVRVITGQGLHSADGPVVRDAIENLLRRRCPKEVLEWARAPRRQGGQGALILFLCSSGKP